MVQRSRISIEIEEAEGGWVLKWSNPSNYGRHFGLQELVSSDVEIFTSPLALLKRLQALLKEAKP